jgi:hypothetical protein
MNPQVDEQLQDFPIDDMQNMPANDMGLSMDPMPMEQMPMDELDAIHNIEDESLLTDEEINVLRQEQELESGESEALVNEDHYRNLASELKHSKLSVIAQELIELVEDDDTSRKDWYSRVKDGIRNLGVSSKTIGGASFEGASTVVHPVLMESCTQFQARAIQEMWPPGGPVQTRVLGEQTPEKQDQAERVMNYMNYLYTVKMTEAFTQEDNMLLRLPISGSAFKKMYHDPIKGRLSSIFVEPADFIVSYQTEDLMYSPRFTHRIREYKNDVRKKEATGFYFKQEKHETQNAHNENDTKPELIDEIDATEGKTKGTTTVIDEDRATMYEVYVDYIVEDEFKADGIQRPYIITVDRDLQTIKRIQRNWKPDDETTTKRMYFTHYKFTPGLGFYGYGFLHLIGDMADTATGTLRALLDAAAFANLQGGFKTRDSRVPSSDKPIKPGQWREVNSSYEDLSKAFFPLPYKEPSNVLFQLLGYVDDKARHLAGITEVNTGEQNAKNSPVGTTAMLLEQGTKVFTAIHKRMHEAHKQEFKIMAELVEENMPAEGYPYLLGTDEGILMPEDFDQRVDVLPISDPNISSNAQRVAKAQSILELQQAYPEVIGEREAVKRMLEAIQVQNIEALIGSPEDWDAQDKAAGEEADKQAAIEEERIRIETEKLNAEADKARSDTTKNNLDAIQSSFEAAALAKTNPELAAIADALMKSAGFIDFDEAGLMPKGLPGMEPGQEQALDQGMPGPEEQMTLPQQDSDNLMELTGQAEPEGEMPLMPPMSEEEMVMAEQQAPQEQMPPISEEEAMMMEQQMAEERV